MPRPLHPLPSKTSERKLHVLSHIAPLHFSLDVTHKHVLREGARNQRWAKCQLSTFDLYPGGYWYGVQEQICDILRPQLAMNLATQNSHTLKTYIGGGGRGGGRL
jgi:hypothetical protein